MPESSVSSSGAAGAADALGGAGREDESLLESIWDSARAPGAASKSGWLPEGHWQHPERSRERSNGAPGRADDGGASRTSVCLVAKPGGALPARRWQLPRPRAGSRTTRPSLRPWTRWRRSRRSAETSSSATAATRRRRTERPGDGTTTRTGACAQARCEMGGKAARRTKEGSYLQVWDGWVQPRLQGRGSVRAGFVVAPLLGSARIRVFSSEVPGVGNRRFKACCRVPFSTKVILAHGIDRCVAGE